MSPKLRLGLMAGAAMLVSSPALAANECGDPSANGAAADSFACASPPTYATGLDYSTTSNGDLTITLQNRFDTGTAATGGIRMFGKTGEDMTLLRQDNPAGAGDPRIVNTAGRAIDITTQGDGNVVINLTDGDPASGETTNVNTGTAPIRITGGTDAIRAEALGSGSVNVTFAAGGPAAVISAGAMVGSNGSGIVARTTSGAIDIEARGASISTNGTNGGSGIEAVSTSGNIAINAGSVSGRLRGILAQTGGAGGINLTLNGGASAGEAAGVAAIDLVAGTGGVSVIWNGGGVSAGAGYAIRAAGASGVTIQNNSGTLFGRVDFSGVTAGGANLTFISTSIVNGYWSATGSSIFSNQSDTVTLSGYPVGSVLNTGASINFAAGNDTFNVATKLTSTGTLDFGAGADVFNVSGIYYTHGGTISFGSDNDTFNLTGSITRDYNSANGLLNLDFGAGTDTFNQGGTLVWNGGAISNLEAFNNSGTIFLGGQRSQIGSVDSDGLDGDAADTLVLSGGVFTGSGDSRIVLESNLNAHASQLGCSTPTVAECANFTGATTAGSTLLLIKDLSFSIDGGSLNTVVTLVQGSSAAEHFVLDPESDYYGETSQGQAIRKPMVAYRLVYDAANQRHVLVGAPTDEVEQASVLATTGGEIWRATTGSWLTRQADLRATPGGLQSSAGFWARAGAQAGEREASAVYDVSGLTLDYDLDHKQRIAHLAFGADLVGGAGWVVGAAVGFVRSDVEFDVTTTEASATGYTGGLYASYVAGPLFVDAAANLNLLHVKADTPELGLGLDVPMKFDMKSLGGQVEAGWRIDAGGFFVEPLAGVSYVVTRIDDTTVPGGSGAFDFEDAKSLRLGGGARVGADSELAGMTASYSLTGRYWNDSEGESRAGITTLSGSSGALSDDFSGGFSEVAASLGLYSPGGGVSGFANLGGKFANGYQAIDGSAGVRVRW